MLENFNWQHYCKRHPECKTEYCAKNHCKNKFPINISRLSDDQLIFRTNSNTDLHLKLPTKLPTNIDLRSKFSACYDQGSLGSCTSNALVAAYQYLTPTFMGSRLFLYYNERVIEGSVKEDAGAYIHDGVKSLKTTGLCPETSWPYIVSQFATKPPDTCYILALARKIINAYNVVQTLTAMKGYLIAGFPFVVGILCYNSFISMQVEKDGLVPMPPINKKDTKLGGHCVLCIGFSDTIKCPGSPPGSWLMRNSWGVSWGIQGYFWIPYGYLINKKLTSDCWEITHHTDKH